MNEARRNHASTVLFDGKVLVTGGFGYSDSLKSSELYDPLTRNWSKVGSMNYDRLFHTSSRLPDGRVIVTGGYGHDSSYSTFTVLETSEIYNTTT